MTTDNNTAAVIAGVCSNNADHMNPATTPFGAADMSAGDNGDFPAVPMIGDFTDDLFDLLDDGCGEAIAEDDETPCFCRGTRIRTPVARSRSKTSGSATDC